MKHTNHSSLLTIPQSRAPRYPGAANDQYFSEKALNILTAIVSGMGMVSAMLFLVTLC